MDILLHITGLAFIPLMAYMVIGGVGDIWAGLREYYGGQGARVGLKTGYRKNFSGRFQPPALSLPAAVRRQTGAPAPLG